MHLFAVHSWFLLFVKRNLLDFFVDITNYVAVKALIWYWCLWGKFKANLCEATVWGLRWLLKKFQTVLNWDQLVFNYLLWCLLISLQMIVFIESVLQTICFCWQIRTGFCKDCSILFLFAFCLLETARFLHFDVKESAYLLPSKPNILTFDEQKENFAMYYITKHFTWVSVDSDQWDHVLWTDVWSKTYLYLFVYFISEH